MSAFRVIWSALALAATLATADSLAAEPPATPQACAQIAHDVERLACYDRLAGRTAAPPAATAIAPPAPAARSAGAAAPAAAAKASAPVAPPPKESFGLYTAEHPAAPAVANSMGARVIDVGKSPNGHTTVTLEGGQLWELFEPDPLLSAGDTVTINRTALGSFMMQTPTKRSHRVHRLR
jgi:hypothetical protein